MRALELIVESNGTCTTKADASARTEVRRKAGTYQTGVAHWAGRHVALVGPRRGVSRALARKHPRCASVSYDEMGLLSTDGPPMDDVMVLYEDKDEHIHAETPASGSLPIRMKLQAAIERCGLSELGHTVQLKDYDIFDEEFVQDLRWPNVIWWMHPASVKGAKPTMLRLLKCGCTGMCVCI